MRMKLCVTGVVAMDAGVPGVRLPVMFSDAELATDRPSPALGQDDAPVSG